MCVFIILCKRERDSEIDREGFILLKMKHLPAILSSSVWTWAIFSLYLIFSFSLVFTETLWTAGSASVLQMHSLISLVKPWCIKASEKYLKYKCRVKLQMKKAAKDAFHLIAQTWLTQTPRPVSFRVFWRHRVQWASPTAEEQTYFHGKHSVCMSHCLSADLTSPVCRGVLRDIFSLLFQRINLFFLKVLTLIRVQLVFSKSNFCFKNLKSEFWGRKAWSTNIISDALIFFCIYVIM